MRTAVIAPLLAGLLVSGCREKPPREVHDLAADALLARHRHAGGERSYLAPPATQYQRRAGARGDGQNPRLVSTVIFDWPEPAERELHLDVEHSGWGSGQVYVTLNRTPLPGLRLEAGRQTCLLTLPRAGQLRGRNRVRLVFGGGDTGAPPPPDGPPARVHGIGVGLQGQPRATWTVLRRPSLDGPEVLVQGANTTLEFALRVPEMAELVFAPRVPAEAGAAVRFRVELGFQGGPASELARLELAPRERADPMRLRLPVRAGKPARLALVVESEAPDALGEWVAPRVLASPVAEVAPQAAAMALEPLRRRLRDARVLLIFLDAAGAKHFGSYGYARETTPVLDQLAAEGYLFERAYSPASATKLSMTSLWTARHPEQHHHGARFTGPLPEARPILPELLAARGVWVTAFIGNPNAAEASGLARGFERVWPLRLSLKPRPGSLEAPSSLDRIVASVVGGGPGPSLTYLHYVEPHLPYDPPAPFDTRFGPDTPLPPRTARDPRWFRAVNEGRRRPTEEQVAHLVRLYDGNLAVVDHEIGLLRERLEEAGLWDDLLVIVTADHGEAFLEHGQLTHASQVYDESVKIPLIIRLPGGGEPVRMGGLVDLIDLGTTLADVFGVAAPASAHFEGRSLLPMMAGEAPAPRAIVSRNARERPTYAWYDDWLKLVHDPRWGTSELYDLRADPGEGRDLAASRPLATELLRQSLYRWLRDLDRGEPAAASEAELSPEAAEALRALGYVE